MSLSALCAYASSSDDSEVEESSSKIGQNEIPDDPEPPNNSKNDEIKLKNFEFRRKGTNFEQNSSNLIANSTNLIAKSTNLTENSSNVSENLTNLIENPSKSGNFFDLGEQESASDSDSESQNDDRETPLNENEQESASRRPKLPSAMSVLSSNVSSSVFRNFYREAEDAEFECLERHVKMTEQNRHVTDQLRQRPIRKSRAVCVMFKKGRCRYDADQCRFSHVIGQNLMNRLTPGGEPPGGGASSSSGAGNKSLEEPASIFEGTAVRYNEREEEIEEPKRPPKKRVGVSDTLQPPKKALKLFDKERKQEAPWMFNK